MERPRPSSLTAPSIWYDEVAVPHRKSFGKPAGACPSVDGLVSLSADWAGLAIPSADQPASFAKCRRENLPNIAFSRAGVDLIGGNSVDLECDGCRRFAIDESDAVEKF